ncbi:uncharacterized protein ACIB01_013465 [Guaruba guarouba]
MGLISPWRSWRELDGSNASCCAVPEISARGEGHLKADLGMNLLDVQLAPVTSKALTLQRVEQYLNYFRIQMTAKPKPLWAHICSTAFAAQSVQQPITDGNINKGCQNISVQRSYDPFCRHQGLNSISTWIFQGGFLSS